MWHACHTSKCRHMRYVLWACKRSNYIIANAWGKSTKHVWGHMAWHEHAELAAASNIISPNNFHVLFTLCCQAHANSYYAMISAHFSSCYFENTCHMLHSMWTFTIKSCWALNANLFHSTGRWCVGDFICTFPCIEIGFQKLCGNSKNHKPHMNIAVVNHKSLLLVWN